MVLASVPMWLALCLFMLPIRAYAYEDQVGLAAQVGYSGIRWQPNPQSGLAVEVNTDLGIAQAWAARGFVGYAYHPETGGPAHTVLWGTEFVYMLDVLIWVPFLGGGMDAWVHAHGDRVLVRPAVHLVVGVDYLAARDWSLGLNARLLSVAPAVADYRFTHLWVTAGVRVVLDD